MARDEKVISVFVASPSDVTEERDKLESVINEINGTLSRRIGVRLDLIRYEREVPPGLGEDPQSVINENIPQDYDIFIGILWHRMGTPTNRSGSGTLEEFNLAKARYDEDSNSVRLMMYFKDTPLNMSDLDADQLKAVQNFRLQVESLGYYKKFTKLEEFEQAIRMHLMGLMLDYQDKEAQTEEDLSDNFIRDNIEDELDENELDEGVFELGETFEEEMDGFNEVLIRTTSAVEDMGERMKNGTKELESLHIPPEPLNAQERRRLRAAAKPLLKRAAADMDEFVSQVKPDLPLLRQHLDSAMDTFIKAVPIYIEMGQDVSETKESMEEMLESMDGAIASMQDMGTAIHGFPRLTAHLTKSRKETGKVIQEIVNIMSSGRSSVKSALSILSK